MASGTKIIAFGILIKKRKKEQQKPVDQFQALTQTPESSSNTSKVQVGHLQ